MNKMRCNITVCQFQRGFSFHKSENMKNENKNYSFMITQLKPKSVYLSLSLIHIHTGRALHFILLPNSLLKYFVAFRSWRHVLHCILSTLDTWNIGTKQIFFCAWVSHALSCLYDFESDNLTFPSLSCRHIPFLLERFF